MTKGPPENEAAGQTGIWHGGNVASSKACLSDSTCMATAARLRTNPSQRGVIGAKMAKLKVGRPSQEEIDGIPSIAPSLDRIAGMMGVSRDTVVEAKVVLAEGTPEEIKSVEEGKAAVSSTAASRMRAYSVDRCLHVEVRA